MKSSISILGWWLTLLMFFSGYAIKQEWISFHSALSGFLAASISLISSLIIWTLSEAKKKADKEKGLREETRRIMQQLVAEIGENLKLCEKMRNFLHGISSMSADTFQKTRIVLFETFHLNLTERAYDEVVTRIADSDTVKELRIFNQTLKYGSQLLRATARSIQNEVPKTLERSFSVSWHPQLFQEALKKSVDNNPWWQHLDVILAEIEKHKETFLPKMQDLAKQK